MKQEEAEKLAIKVLKDLNYHYINKPIKVLYKKKDSPQNEFKFNIWSIYIPCENDELKGDEYDNHIVCINDESSEPIYFLDGSGGRVPFFKLKKINDKFFIEGEFKFPN